MPHALSSDRVLVGLILVVLLAIAGGRPWGRAWRTRLGLEPLLSSKFIFLPIGMLLSRAGLGVLDAGAVRELDALVTLGLGVLGLLLGLQGTKPPSRRLAWAAGGESFLTLLLVALPAYALLRVASPLDWRQRAAAAALLGCAAVISSDRISALAPARDQEGLRAVRHLADLSAIIGVIAAGVLLALLPANGHEPRLERLLTLAAIGSVGGVVAWLLAGDTRSETLRITLLLGVLLLTAGTATHLGLPPVAATLLMGLTLANLPGTAAAELRESLAFLEAPLRVVLIVIAGAALQVPTLFALLMLAIFLALRTAGKVVGGRLAAVIAPGELPRQTGLGLLPSSAVALGLALDFQAMAPGTISQLVVATVTLGSFFSESAGLWTTWLLARTHVISEAAFEIVVDTAADPAPGESVR